jgi:hypothetical protein
LRLGALAGPAPGSEARRAAEATPAAELEEVIAGAEAALWRLREAIAAADPKLLSAVLREMVAKVEFH